MNDNAFAVRLDKIAAAIAQTASVEKIILLGSRAPGDHNPRSDIDIAVNRPYYRPARMAGFM